MKIRAGSLGRLVQLAWALLALLALLGIWSGWQTALRGLQEKQSDREIRGLEAVPDPRSAGSTVPRLEQQLSGNADSKLPGAQEARARSHLLLAAISAVPSEQVAHLRAAENAARRAIALRPSWAYGWMLYARVRLQLRPRDPELPHIVRVLLATGIRDFNLQRQLFQLRIDGIGGLDPGLDQALQQALIQGVLDHGERLAALVIRSGYGHWVCAEPGLRPRIDGLCRRHRL